MGACLSCLGLRRHTHDDADHSRLLYDDLTGAHSYGTWGASSAPSQNVMSPEEVQREQEALDNITRWASDQIVEIFPHQHRSLTMSSSQINGQTESTASSSHHDILLSLIPGDKSKRSIRIYPASRPTSKDAQSLRSKSSFAAGINGIHKNQDSSVLVKLDVNLR
ncbi:uncharacterized protein Z518_03760 [Rhinocladiella mackenziei CBS 650.93]|uniref:Late endosomal/lysosomal adaptor and MAPK and MTOR activator 1 n=1 Tax=Rhinocladiella mackenziei CBS 650.93 TaxID=1442369 RepID=A0A0D2H5V2_9EURO|nr:uncharacterized protein Z518_03760 [Rhinocladiella mackenziei CBS 650.93]KIX05788.1 hypothetical protein Z518_03760 [Rhinocladiella mackenziei CBS 650.93]